MRFVFDDDPANTEWLKSLTFYVENEKGERFEGISNGTSASGDLDTPMMKTFMLESAFFAESRELTMHITGAAWLDKDSERILVDLKNKSAESLPKGVKLERVLWKQNGWKLYASAPYNEEKGSFQIFGWDYYDTQGNEYSFSGMSTTTFSYYDESIGETVKTPERFVQILELYDYGEDQVWLSPQYTHRGALPEPIAVKIK